MREIELLKRKHDRFRGLDSVSWGILRDIFLREKVISENGKGHYLLCRDLHTIPFWQLKEWIENVQSLEAQDLALSSDWQRAAYALLLDDRKNQRELLNINLAELFNR